MSSENIAKGVTLGHAEFSTSTEATSAIGSSTSIASIVNVTPPSQSREMVANDTVSADTLWMQKLPGMIDAGEITFTLQYDGESGESANTLQTKFAAGTKDFWVVQLGDDTSTSEAHSAYIAPGYISDLGVQQVEKGQLILQDATITLTDEVTFSPIS